MKRKELGNLAEDIAAKYLAEQGLEIVARNYYVRNGEIDIVAFEGEMVVFVEVRSKSHDRYGTAEDTISLKKQRFLYRAAEQFLLKENMSERICRFDVVAVSFANDTQIKWYKDAFRL